MTEGDSDAHSLYFFTIMFRLIAYPLKGLRGRSAKKKTETIQEQTDQTGSCVKHHVYIQGPQVYSCSNCRTHLATQYEIVSRAFQGRGGRAYLFDNVVNVTTGKLEERLLMTGMHTVADITCSNCDQLLGWKYEEAYEESQKYKEGKYILEKARIYREEEGW